MSCAIGDGQCYMFGPGTEERTRCERQCRMATGGEMSSEIEAQAFNVETDPMDGADVVFMYGIHQEKSCGVTVMLELPSTAGQVGLMLADVAQNYARAYAQEFGGKPEDYLVQISNMFNTELKMPTTTYDVQSVTKKSIGEG